MTKFGIAENSVSPMRLEPSERSEMVSQVLFGELFEELEESGKWAHVRMCHDDTEGWIERRFYLVVSLSYARRYMSKQQSLSTEVFSMVQKSNDYKNKLVVPGSVLPFLNDRTQEFKIGKVVYKLLTRQAKSRADDIRKCIISNALLFYNTPYLWGGRSPYGIDDSGFTQLVYRLAGLMLPREASKQILFGEDYSFVEEAMPGDLAFFGDEISVTHVGIIWEQSRIIHASGRVRIDRVDHQGIFNEELKRYTHNLKVIKHLVID